MHDETPPTTERLSGQEMVVRARRIATRAHTGQRDKAGEPYIGHPGRVAARLDGPRAQAVGWLHDVVEDTAVTLDELRRAGFDEQVLAAVDAVTRRDGEDPEHYYARVRRSDLALAVKLADIADNADEQRLARLDAADADRLRAKYAKARAHLLGTQAGPAV